MGHSKACPVYDLSAPKRAAKKYTTSRIAIAMFNVVFVGVVRGLRGSIPRFSGDLIGDLQKGSAERGFPDLFRKQVGTNRKKTEQIRTSRGIPENKERKSEEIGTDRDKLENKSPSADPRSGAPI